MGGRRVRWLAAGVISALVGAVLQAGIPTARASVAAGRAAPARAGAGAGGGLKITAGPGHDFVTGLGSPRAGVDQALAAAP